MPSVLGSSQDTFLSYLLEEPLTGSCFCLGYLFGHYILWVREWWFLRHFFFWKKTFLYELFVISNGKPVKNTLLETRITQFPYFCRSLWNNLLIQKNVYFSLCILGAFESTMQSNTRLIVLKITYQFNYRCNKTWPPSLPHNTYLNWVVTSVWIGLVREQSVEQLRYSFGMLGF